MKNKKTAGKIVFWVLLVLLLVLCLGFVAKFTGGFREGFKTFYVTVDGKDIVTAGYGYSATKQAPLAAEVHYLLDDGEAGYTVRVVPNTVEGKDFDFIVDGQVYSYQAEADLTDGFTITQDETGFTVMPKGDTLTETLRYVYAGKIVDDCEASAYRDMFTLVVTPNNGEEAVEIHFAIMGSVEGVILDKEAVIF